MSTKYVRHPLEVRFDDWKRREAAGENDRHAATCAALNYARAGVAVGCDCGFDERCEARGVPMLPKAAAPGGEGT